MIDLRSDTVTKPTLEMKEAMINAQVGDCGYDDDPTILELEAKAAKLLGKEAALFVVSGVNGNQVSILTHTNPGDEVILGEHCHIMEHEKGSAARISNVTLRTVRGKNDILDLAEIQAAIRPTTKLLCLENALGSGVVVDLHMMKKYYQLAHENGIKVHLDGARIFNAAKYLNCEAKEIAQYCDSVMFCLSKGLCAPVGSLICGSKEFIEKAKANRYLLGGMIRQGGILAACGLVALDKMIDRLSVDHENALLLAKGLASCDKIEIDLDNVMINMVFFDFKDKVDDQDFINYLDTKGIKINPRELGKFRLVTNKDVTKEDCLEVVAAIKSYLKG